MISDIVKLKQQLNNENFIIMILLEWPIIVQNNCSTYPKPLVIRLTTEKAYKFDKRIS